jgi:hypothetical protein
MHRCPELWAAAWAQMSAMLLANKVLAFYEWEGDVAEHLDAVRAEINRLASTWSPQQKVHCLQETAASFTVRPRCCCCCCCCCCCPAPADSTIGVSSPGLGTMGR